MKMIRVTAEVHKQYDDRYRVKVSIHDDGMYINGFMVFPPNDEHEWSVYPPSLNMFGRYIYLVEFNKTKQLWNEVYKACIEAVEVWQASDGSKESQRMAGKSSEVERVSEVRKRKPTNIQDNQYL